MKFEDVSGPNRDRMKRWHDGAQGWVSADTSNAMCGEAGEAANVVKKLRRIETGVTLDEDGKKHKHLVHDLALELADTFLYIDLLAAHYGIDLPAAIKQKFNMVSRELKFPERIK